MITLSMEGNQFLSNIRSCEDVFEAVVAVAASTAVLEAVIDVADVDVAVTNSLIYASATVKNICNLKKSRLWRKK